MDRKRFTLEIPWPNMSRVRLAPRLTGWLPTRGNVIFTLVIAALLVLAQSAGALPLGRPQAAPAAASTGTIAYQGRLADAAGKPLTGTYNMIFRLYDAATGGTPLWSEQWTGSNGVRVSDGLFNVMLGSLTALPISQFTNSQSLFLGITVGTDDEMAPRVQLGSVPFAVQALTVPDGSVTTAKIADGAVTPSKLNIDDGLIVQGDKLQIVDGRLALNSTGLNTPWSRIGAGKNTPIAGEIEFGDATGWTFQFTRSSDKTRLAYFDDHGNFAASGAKSAIVKTISHGQRKLYAVEAPDVRFSDEGMARLQNAQVRVTLEPIFLETIEGEYLVQITPYGDASLYVAEIGADYFVVKARAGDPDVAFAWRLSATRKGYAGVRLEEVKGADHEAAK